MNIFQGDGLMYRGFYPTGGKLISKQNWMRKEEAYYKAISFISIDPMRNICEITHRGDTYTVKCFKSSLDEKMSYDSGDDCNVMFFSEKYYIWKKETPGGSG